MISSPAARKLLVLLYLAAILVLADQLADLTATVMANVPAPGAPTWRFGAFGLLVSRASVFLVADVMLFTAAVGLGHRRVLRGLGVIHVLVAVGLLGGLGLFSLDWLQVRRGVRRGGIRAFDLAAFRAAGVTALAILVTAWAGVAALRASHVSRAKGNRREEAPGLLIDIRHDKVAP